MIHQALARARSVARWSDLPGARFSSELDIVSEAEMRRRHFARLAEEAAAAREARIARQVDAIAALVPPAAPINFDRIAKAVCQHFDKPRALVFSDSRANDVVYPRHITAHLMAKYTGMSFAKIARCMGRMDHTTSRGGALWVREQLAAGDERVTADVAAIEAVVGITGQSGVRRSVHVWTESAVEQLTQLWASGMPSAQIAKVMGLSSRDSVNHKAHHLGLPHRRPRVATEEERRATAEHRRLHRNERERANRARRAAARRAREAV